MKRQILIATTAALFTVSGSTLAFAQSADSSNRNSNQNQNKSADRQQNSAHGQQGQNAQAPKGFILLEESTVYMMAREPQQHLLRAHEQLEANNPKAAAAELRLAGAYLKMQEARPGDEAKDVLSHWQQKIDELAGRVEKGDVKSQELTRAANGANYALAKYFDQRAKTEMGQQHKQVQAGYDLQAAADCFEQSMLWSNQGNQASGQQARSNNQGRSAQNTQKLEQQDVKAIQDARLAAERLISAENLASSDRQSQAQLASGKEGPGHQAQGSSNSSSSHASQGQSSTQSEQQAVGELAKCIDARGSQFSSPDNGSNSQSHSNTESASNSKGK